MVLYRVKQIYKEVPPYCQHGKTATLYLSRTKANFNRPFFKCANNHDPCSYFQWADQEPNEYTLARNHPSYLPPPPPSPAAELKKKKKRFLNPVKQITSIRIRDTRHLPIVLVKVAYYASGSARFLPKLCSNYARFSKLCYFFKKLFCAQTSQLTRQF